MNNEDAILSATVVYSEQEVLSEFQECCEEEAESPSCGASSIYSWIFGLMFIADLEGTVKQGLQPTGMSGLFIRQLGCLFT